MAIRRIFSLLLCCIAYTAHAEVKAVKTITIGVLAPLTGGPAEQGQWVLQGAELAKDLLEKTGKVKVVLKVEDTQADPKLAIAAFQKIRGEGDLLAVVTYGSGVGMAISPFANQYKIIQMGVATGTPAYSSPDDYNFRNFPSAELEGQFLVQQAIKKTNAPNVTIVRINNEYGLATAKAFSNILAKSGGKIIAEEILDPAATDYRSTITKIKTKTSDLVYIASYPNEGALFLKQAYELGLKPVMLASTAIVGAKNFFQLAGEGSEGLLVSSSVPAFLGSKSGEIKEFVEAYHKKLNEEPSVEQMYAARSYDAVRLIVGASLQCQDNDTACVKDKLTHTKDFKGPSGNITFDLNGDVANEFSLLRIHNKKFEIAD